MNIVPFIRLYLTVDGKKTALPAGEVALDIDDAEAQSLIVRDVAREATAGEVAEASDKVEASKPKRAGKKAKAEKTADASEGEGADTAAGGDGAGGDGADTAAVTAGEGDTTDINDLA